MRPTLAFLLLALTATSASAQSPYVGGSLVADIVRFSGNPDSGATGSGESLGGALRVGTSLGEHLGVDLEFARTGDIESTPAVRILTGVVVPAIETDPLIFPQPEISTRRQASTLTTTLWWRQELGDRFDLMYFGGVAFTRTEARLRIVMPFVPIPFPVPGPGVPRAPQVIEQESVSYGSGVAVGLDGRIGMTEHLRLVPGLRLLTVSGGWVVRPAVGLHWVF